MLDNGEILAVTQCSIRSNRGVRADIVGTSTDGSRLVLFIEGLAMTFIGEGQARARKIRAIYARAWSDIDMLSRGQLLEEVCRDRPSEPQGALRRHKSLQLAVLGFLHETMQYIELESYDIALASHVLHTTDRLDVSAEYQEASQAWRRAALDQDH